MDYSLPGSSVHEILQARILAWVAMPSSRGSSDPGIEPGLPHCRKILYHLSHQGSLVWGQYIKMPKKIILTSKNILKAVEVLHQNEH